MATPTKSKVKLKGEQVIFSVLLFFLFYLSIYLFLLSYVCLILVPHLLVQVVVLIIFFKLLLFPSFYPSSGVSSLMITFPNFSSFFKLVSL